MRTLLCPSGAGVKSRARTQAESHYHRGGGYQRTGSVKANVGPPARTLSNVSIFAGCVLIWGTTWLAITYQLGSVAPEVSVSHRFLFAALIVAAWCKWRGLSLLFTRSEHVALALMGVAMYGVSYVFVYHAEQHVASGLVAIGYSASPLLSTFGTRIFFRQPVTARVALGSLFGIVGITFVYWPELARLAQSQSVALGAAFPPPSGPIS